MDTLVITKFVSHPRTKKRLPSYVLVVLLLSNASHLIYSMHPLIFKGACYQIFLDMVKDTIKVFMDDFSIVVDTFESCLEHLSNVLERYVENNIVLN